MPAPSQSQVPSDIVLDIGGNAPVAPAAPVLPNRAPYDFALDPSIARAAPPAPVQAPAQDPSALLNTILQKLGADTVASQPAAPPAPLRGVQMDGTYRGKDVTIYTSTGDSHTAEEFDAALGAYNKTGKAPQGFTVLEPGVMSTLRSGFETARAPLRKAVEELDDPNLPLNKYLPGFVSAVPKFLARQVNEQVKTPEKAGLLIGTIAAGPLLGATAATTTLAGRLSVPTLVGNALKTVAGAGIGGAAADIATGEEVDPGKLGVELGIIAVGSGFQGVVSHVVGKYVRPDLQGKVMDDMKNAILKRYGPNIANNPNGIDLAASSPDVLYQMGRQMSAGIRGTVDAVAGNMLNDINAVLPMRLSVGLQATFRARTRDLARAGNAMLDAGADQGALRAATADFNAATANIGDLVKNQVAEFVQQARPSMTNMQPMISKVHGVLSKYHADMTQFEEGAQFMGYLNKATQGKGFDPLIMKDQLLNAYGHNRTALVKEVQDILAGRTVGFPQSELTNLPTVTESIANPNAKFANVIKSILPVPNAVKALLPGGKSTVTRSVLPYQVPQRAPAALNIGSQLAGQDAINSFMDRQ